jgi:hypothetical protein
MYLGVTFVRDAVLDGHFYILIVIEEGLGYE